MDGLNLGDECSRIDSWNPFVSNFYTTNGFSGLFPTCLLNSIKNITDLRMSGNLLPGDASDLIIPEDSKLVNVVLSANNLHGKLSSSFQNFYKLKELDLSYNRINGEVNLNVTDCDISLEVNRFSGFIPKSVHNQMNISILSGNLFDCDSHHKLPEHDSSKDSYICGSSQLDDSIILYYFIFGMIFIAIIIYQFYTKDNDHHLFKFISTFLSLIWKYMGNVVKFIKGETSLIAIFNKVNIPDNMFKYLNILSVLSHVSILFALFVFFTTIIIYPIFKITYSTHDNQYSWYTSFTLIYGFAPAITYCTIFLIVLVTLIVFHRVYVDYFILNYFKVNKNFEINQLIQSCKMRELQYNKTMRENNELYINSNVVDNSLHLNTTNPSHSSNNIDNVEQLDDIEINNDENIGNDYNVNHDDNNNDDDVYDDNDKEDNCTNNEEDYDYDEEAENNDIQNNDDGKIDDSNNNDNDNKIKNEVGDNHNKSNYNPDSRIVVDVNESIHNRILNNSLYIEKNKSPKNVKFRDRFTFYSLILLNIVLCTTINCLYTLSQYSDNVNSDLKLLIQLTVSLWSIYWNNEGIRVICNKCNLSVKSGIFLRLALKSFNTIISPCISCLFTSPNCMRPYFFGTKTITSTFNVVECIDQSYSNGVIICSESLDVPYVSSFQVPFTYHGLCMSSILTTFIPICIYDYAFNFLASIAYMYIASRLKYQYGKSLDISRLLWFECDLTNLSSALLNMQQLFARILYNIALLLTFGLSSPVLAIVICFAIVFDVSIYFWIVRRYYIYTGKLEQASPIEVFEKDRNSLNHGMHIFSIDLESENNSQGSKTSLLDTLVIKTDKFLNWAVTFIKRKAKINSYSLHLKYNEKIEILEYLATRVPNNFNHSLTFLILLSISFCFAVAYDTSINNNDAPSLVNICLLIYLILPTFFAYKYIAPKLSRYILVRYLNC